MFEKMAGIFGRQCSQKEKEESEVQQAPRYHPKAHRHQHLKAKHEAAAEGDRSEPAVVWETGEGRDKERDVPRL